jgi:hypothetical protein
MGRPIASQQASSSEQGAVLANFLTYGAENIYFDPETKTYKVKEIPICRGMQAT